MVRILFIFFLSIFFSLHCFSQKLLISPDNADCYNAIELTTDSFGPTNPPIGYGKIMEINADKKSLISFEKEHNTVWYKFTAKNNCVLTFDIIPIDPKDDYDFILYQYTDENFCEEVMTKEIKPVRTNIARSVGIKGGLTGLSIFAQDTFVSAGYGPTYSRALEVGKGEIYYLVVDNVYKNGKGHTLKLHYQYCSNPKRRVIDHNDFSENENIDDLEADTNAIDEHKPKSTLNIEIVDKQTKKPITGTIDILNSKTLKLVGKDYRMENVSKCTKTVNLGKKYIIQSTSEGYFPAVKEKVIKEKTLYITIMLEKIEVGKNISMDNIYFYGNTDKFLASSGPALRNLLNVLKTNKNLKIRIDGHVNWPKNFTTQQEEKFNMDLSFSRAKAVYDFVVKGGINPKRLDYEGFSNAKMVYPHPANEEESQMNRRVEIEILSN